VEGWARSERPCVFVDPCELVSVGGVAAIFEVGAVEWYGKWGCVCDAGDVVVDVADDGNLLPHMGREDLGMDRRDVAVGSSVRVGDEDSTKCSACFGCSWRLVDCSRRDY